MGRWELNYGVEYLSEDSWRDVVSSTIPPGVFDAGMLLLRDKPQFMENPLHIAQIAKSLRSGARSVISDVLNYGPKAIDFVGKLGKLIG